MKFKTNEIVKNAIIHALIVTLMITANLVTELPIEFCQVIYVHVLKDFSMMVKEINNVKNAMQLAKLVTLLIIVLHAIPNSLEMK